MMRIHSRTQEVRGLWRARVPACWLLVLSLTPGLALAALGGDSSTIERDVAQLRAQRSVATSNVAASSGAAPSAYSVHELVLPGGTHVREYLSQTQQVFAVAWRGPTIPDLQQLLGSYFPRYSAAVKAKAQPRRPLSVQDSDLVIHTGGHMHAFFGIAYLPGQMPSGVRVEEIR